MTKEQRERLPKFAQEYIIALEREREMALRALNQYVDDQSPSPIYIDEYECTGEDKGPTKKRRYVQTRNLMIEYAGVELSIFLASKDDHQREYGIQLCWTTPNHAIGRVAMIPTGFQNVSLVAKENMA